MSKELPTDWQVVEDKNFCGGTWFVYTGTSRSRRIIGAGKTQQQAIRVARSGRMSFRSPEPPKELPVPAQPDHVTESPAPAKRRAYRAPDRIDFDERTGIYMFYENYKPVGQGESEKDAYDDAVARQWRPIQSPLYTKNKDGLYRLRWLPRGPNGERAP
jgi:hypothetical protein